MDDLIKSVKAHLYDRVVSPLSSAFLISWVAWNYRVVLIILSADTIPVKFKNIDNFYSATIDITFTNPDLTLTYTFFAGLFAPLCSALAYIYLYPLVSLPIYRYSLKMQRLLQEEKNKHQESRLLTRAESRELITQHSQLELQLEKAQEDHLKKIRALTETINQLQVQLAPNAKPDDINKDITSTKSENAAEPTNELTDEDIDKIILKALQKTPKNKMFKFSELIDEDEWYSFSRVGRQAIGKEFKSRVSRGDYPDISLGNKDSGNQQLYIVNSHLNQISDEEAINKVLSCYLTIGSSHRLNATKASEITGLHHMKVQVIFDKLVSTGFLKSIAMGNGAFSYELLPSGRKYIVDNNLHEQTMG